MRLSFINTLVALVLVCVALGVVGYLLLLIIKALRKYINSSNVRKESNNIKRTLGENIKEYRIKCKMTQEFVAERLGVSRQAVSKWESGISDPSTSNLFALSKLFGITPEELLKNVEGQYEQ